MALVEPEQEQENPIRATVSTLELVFPLIRPSLTPPRSPHAIPVLERTNVHAEIIAPHPTALVDVARQLQHAVSAEQGADSVLSRKGKKRARLATPSPPLSPTLPRPHPGALPRSTQTLRARLTQTHRLYALAPSYWTTPTRTYRHLAPAAAAMIAEALQPEALRCATENQAAPTSAQTGPMNERTSTPGTSTAPSPHVQNAFAGTPSVRNAFAGASSATRMSGEQPARSMGSDLELLFPMDLDLRTDESPVTASAPPPYGLPMRSDAATRPSRLGAPLATVYEEAGVESTSPTLVPSTGFGTEASTLVEDSWSQVFFSSTPQAVMDQPSAPQLPPTTPAPSRFQSQSAAALAALFVPPTPAVTGPSLVAPPTVQGSLIGTATYLAVNDAINQGLGGGYIFTDVPAGGFPEVLFSEPDGLLAGLPRERINAITGGGIGPVLVLHVHNSTFPPQHKLRPLTSAIEGAIHQITGALNPLVVPPEREWTQGGDRRANPFVWTVLGISEDAVNRVMECPVWSSTEVTMHVAHARLQINRFLFVLGGFAHDHNHSILNAVWAVFTGPVVLPTILRLVQTHPEHIAAAPEEAARAILGSLKVRVSTLQNGNLIAAVFCDPPTLSIVRWREWRNTIANLPFPNPMNSTGFVRRPTPCAGCHGYDHPTHLCPFQDVPGWNTPPPGTTWGPPTAGQPQGPPGGLPPPPPPPGGGAASRSRSQGPRRTNSNTFTPPRRDYRGGGDGKAGGSGSGR